MRELQNPQLNLRGSLDLQRDPAGAPSLTAMLHEEPVVSIGHYVWLLRKAWWKIALVTLLVTLLAAFASYHVTPVYEATARLSVDPQVHNAVMGQGAASGLADADDHFFNTEIELIQTDAVLRPVAERFGLMVEDSRNTPPGMAASDAPVTLGGLTVTHPPNSFLINISYRSVDPLDAAAVANAVAHSFRTHSQKVRATASMEESEFIKSQLSALKQRMDDSERALVAYETQMGVINPDEKTSIMESRLQTLNTDFTQAQNDRIQKEVELRALNTGSTAALEVSSQSTELAKAADTMRLAQEKMEAVGAVFGSAMPENKRAASALAEATRRYTTAQADVSKRIQIQFDEASHREQMIRAALAATKSQFDVQNAHSVQYQELKREAEANKSLYAELSRKVQEAGINAAFQGSDIRIADEARPGLRPVFPRRTVFIGLGLFLSAVCSIVAVLLSDLFDKSLRDPMQARREIGLDVVGILPRVKPFERPIPSDTKRLEGAAVEPEKEGRGFATMGFYEEAISSLLTTIRIRRVRHHLRSILVTSGAKGEGKSACVAYLAAAHARQGHRTLLIDADLRCPVQQNYFALPFNQAGLADAVAGTKKLKDLRQSVPGHLRLDVISAGLGNARTTERIGTTVEELLKEAYDDYDMVFIDAPPVLCFAETLHMASVADGVLVMCQAGQTTREQVTAVLTTLQHLGCFPLGLVLNQVRETMSAHYSQYQKYYRILGRAEAAA